MVLNYILVGCPCLWYVNYITPFPRNVSLGRLWSVKTIRLLEASDLLGRDSIMDSDIKIMSKIVIKGWVSCSLTLSCKKFSKPKRKTEWRVAVQDVEEFYFLRFKTSYVIFTSASLFSDGDNLLICFIVPWRTGLHLPMYRSGLYHHSDEKQCKQSDWTMWKIIAKTDRIIF